jgi:energy-coupling factor transport system permease protein
MRNLALGRYIPYNTFIHRLDPRTKLISLILLLIAVFADFNLLGYGFLIITILSILAIAKIKIITVFKSLKPMWLMMSFLLVINVVLIRYGEIAFTIFNYPIYQIAVIQTVSILTRLALMISLTTILTTTTKPLDLTYGLESLMSPLKRVKFPAHEIAMTISIALRFIPTLLEEADKIIKAQASRGVDLAEGKLKDKITALISLIIPLFISSFQRSEELANAMEARGYDPAGVRTRYRILALKRRDVIALIIGVLIMTASIIFSLNPIDLGGIL